jgi:hypothetical protein
MFTAQLVVYVSAGALASVIVIVNVVPLYAICTFSTSPLCRFTPPPSVVAGIVGEAPSV